MKIEPELILMAVLVLCGQFLVIVGSFLFFGHDDKATERHGVLLGACGFLMASAGVLIACA